MTLPAISCRTAVKGEVLIERIRVAQSPAAPENVILESNDHLAIWPERCAAALGSQRSDNAIDWAAKKCCQFAEKAAVIVPGAGNYIVRCIRRGLSPCMCLRADSAA